MVSGAVTFMNLFDPSSWAALALGPKTLQEHDLKVSAAVHPTGMPTPSMPEGLLTAGVCVTTT